MQLLLKNDSHLICGFFIYYRITMLSQRLSRNFCSKHLPTAGPAVSSDQDAQGSDVTNAQGSHCPQHEKPFPYAHAGPLISPQAPCPLASPRAAQWGPWLPLLYHLFRGADSFPRLNQPCFSTSLHKKNGFFPMLQRPPVNLFQFVMSFPKRFQLKAAPKHGLMRAELKDHVIQCLCSC